MVEVNIFQYGVDRQKAVVRIDFTENPDERFTGKEPRGNDAVSVFILFERFLEDLLFPYPAGEISNRI